MEILKKFIGTLNIGEPLTFNHLVIKPILAKSDFKLPYLTLEEAFERNFLVITEKNETGSVPELLVKNTGDLDVIILEGEEIRGAKQNRIANSTMIIPAHSEVVMPVSCVEQGRWRYVSRNFTSGKTVLYPSARQQSHSSVTSNLRANASYNSNQSGIWSNISMKSARMAVHSETRAMSDIADTSITPETEAAMIGELEYQPNQIGFLAFINGGFAGGDVFGSPELCEKQMRKMMRGYYLDALDPEVKFPHLEANAILTEITETPQEQFEAVGKGTEMRFETERIQGAWKLADEGVAHLTVFPKSRS
ncbi:MAG: DUF6569 family protein [Pyrinomonadaceae bacterium]